MKTVRLLMVGFGNVGKAFVSLVGEKQLELSEQYGFRLILTGIASGHHGCAANPEGLDPTRLLSISNGHGNYSELNVLDGVTDSFSLINACPGDVLFENTPVNHHTGQPAIDHLKLGFERNMHGITANKGPVVHGYKALTELALKKGKAFRFESAVMDGAPIFSLHHYCLPATQLLGFYGILNSCTNLLLGRMESGESLESAIQYAQSIGIAETDPSADIDGWDAAIKVAALVTVLMKHPLKPDEIDREGIRRITPEMITAARAEGRRWKLVCTAHKVDDRLEARVHPERVDSDSPLYTVSGTSSYIQFELDTLPGLGVLENNPGPKTTAYGLLSDLINVVKDEI
jgi:homoserine dehydrogenase